MTGSIGVFVPVSTLARKKSLHAVMNAKIAVAVNPGPDSGNTTLRKIPMRLHPSTRAAFSRLTGMELKKLTIIHITRGRMNAV